MADAPTNGGVVVNGGASSAANSVNGREKVEMVPPETKGDLKEGKGEKIPQLREQTGRSRDNATADTTATPNIKSGKDRGVASSRPSSRGADRLVILRMIVM